MTICEELTEGKHMLSGIGQTTFKGSEWEDTTMNVMLFCIDGVVYGAYEDPSDGYRSYGYIEKYEGDAKLYMFSPQPVMIWHDDKTREEDHTDESVLRMVDFKTGKEILTVGTNYDESYYPYCIFHYQPENLYINQNK